MKDVLPTEGDLRVWYCPQVPCPALKIPAPDLATARIVYNALIDLSTFEFDHRIKPDYCDMGGIERFEDGEWCGVEDEDV